MIWTTVTKSPRLRDGSLICVFMWFNKTHTLADSLNMKTQQPVERMAQVPPWKAVIMSETILFWRIAFPIRDISVFSKDQFCQLSLKACWVNLVRASICAIHPPGWWKKGQRQQANDDTSGKQNKPIWPWWEEGCHFSNCGADFPFCPGRTRGATAQLLR